MGEVRQLHPAGAVVGRKPLDVRRVLLSGTPGDGVKRGPAEQSAGREPVLHGVVKQAEPELSLKGMKPGGDVKPMADVRELHRESPFRSHPKTGAAAGGAVMSHTIQTQSAEPPPALLPAAR